LALQAGLRCPGKQYALSRRESMNGQMRFFDA
jgi:hypothetical protein